MVHLRLTHAGSMSGAVKPANAILPPPTRVRLAGLVQASQYNGRIVKIVNVDQEAGRYTSAVSVPAPPPHTRVLPSADDLPTGTR
jgi:hypothetical protein